MCVNVCVVCKRVCVRARVWCDCVCARVYGDGGGGRGEGRRTPGCRRGHMPSGHRCCCCCCRGGQAGVGEVHHCREGLPLPELDDRQVAARVQDVHHAQHSACAGRGVRACAWGGCVYGDCLCRYSCAYVRTCVRACVCVCHAHVRCVYV